MICMSKPNGRSRAARNSATLLSLPGGLLVSIRTSADSRSAVGVWLVCVSEVWPRAAQSNVVAASLNRDEQMMKTFRFIDVCRHEFYPKTIAC